MATKSKNNILIINPDSGEDIHLTLDELQNVFRAVRNNTLNEVLSAVTAKLDPAGNYDAETAKLNVLRSVNDMRESEPENGR